MTGIGAMGKARLGVAVLGVLLPYLARLAGGPGWLAAYLDAGLSGALLIGGFNAIAWLSVLAISVAYRHPLALLAPVIPGFGFIGYAHATLDLSADAQSPVALVFIPIVALLPIVLGGLVGYLFDRRLRRRIPPSAGIRP